MILYIYISTNLQLFRKDFSSVWRTFHTSNISTNHQKCSVFVIVNHIFGIFKFVVSSLVSLFSLFVCQICWSLSLCQIHKLIEFHIWLNGDVVNVYMWIVGSTFYPTDEHRQTLHIAQVCFQLNYMHTADMSVVWIYWVYCSNLFKLKLTNICREVHSYDCLPYMCLFCLK